MSDDLISRKDLLEKVKDYFISPDGALRLIESQPTAYDVGKVIKSINEIGQRYCNSVKCDKNCEDCEHGCLMRAIINAVRSGGIEND